MDDIDGHTLPSVCPIEAKTFPFAAFLAKVAGNASVTNTGNASVTI